jgi:hypothetical protein
MLWKNIFVTKILMNTIETNTNKIDNYRPRTICTGYTGDCRAMDVSCSQKVIESRIKFQKSEIQARRIIKNFFYLVRFEFIVATEF